MGICLQFRWSSGQAHTRLPAGESGGGEPLRSGGSREAGPLSRSPNIHPRREYAAMDACTSTPERVHNTPVYTGTERV